MEMDWEALLDELWSYAASDPKELETKIRACLKGHSSESLLQAISLLITQGQHATARALLTEFLRSHQSADDIGRRLELILHFKKHRAPQMLSIKSKQRSKELLIKDVNDLVASGKLQAAESLLLEAIETFEEPDSLNLLSRVYMLQRRPIDGAKAMQRALLLKRQQQAFVETEPEESTDDLPTESDLAFLNDSAEHLTPLENPTAPTNKALTETVDDSFTFIQNTASQYPALKTDGWWEGQSESTPPEASTFFDEPEASDAPSTAPAATDDSSDAHVTGDENALSSATKTILKLAHPRKETEAGEGSAKVKVFNRSGRSLIPAQPTDLGAPEPSDSDESSLLPTTSSALEVPASPSQTRDEISDENDEDEDYPAHTELALNTPTSPEPNSGLEDQEDPIDLDHDLQDLSIYELGAEQEEDIPDVVDDFRDLDDDYAAYAFDPDEVFDSEDPEADDKADGLADKLSREDRALQKAAELIGRANWSISTLPLVQQIFVMSGWGATRLALEREIDKGLTPDELILAAHIKVIWAENDIYWIAFDKTGSSRLSHQVLSWPTALLIVRSFESLPQVEEIEVFLESLFATWYENNSLRRAFRAFARYLWFRFANLQGCLPASQHFDFCDPRELPAEEYSDLGLYDTLECEKTEILRGYGVFQTKHPQEPGCYFSDKPPVEETPSLNAEKRSKKQADDADMPSDIETEEESIDDDADEAPPQWSAAPLASDLHAQNTDQPSPSIEP
ncbi:hypothetical protein CFY91_06200 [Pseudomonas fluvialis]|uniref:Tetratricopeptide repeat protein n=1 Tax=Pseudomonas fluvialis TaxID=1793966 RepID=A0ABQ2AV47_9PSED|nr:hypothetical protein [Pseudomonas fluvialis]OXM41051.1 hypothetical protein CFY91_06200 [Pseudomonas fluvialis]GGH96294.1 hypothetical protein GCM10007363_27540 [Pseudomonas fluvialis]